MFTNIAYHISFVTVLVAISAKTIDISIWSFEVPEICTVEAQRGRSGLSRVLLA